MLVVMAVDTEVFPVGAIRRVVPWVSVFMMDCKEMAVCSIEFPRAFGAYEAVDFQGLFPVIRRRRIALF